MNDETYELENRTYINPETSMNEQNAFIDKLRQTGQSDLAKISRDTYNLGTPVPSVQGGLSGSGSVWASRYSTPQTNALVSQLRNTAQASALNTALNNLQQQYKEAYNQAYRRAQKRAASRGYNHQTPTLPDSSEDNDLFDKQKTPEKVPTTSNSTKQSADTGSMGSILPWNNPNLMTPVRGLSNLIYQNSNLFGQGQGGNTGTDAPGFWLGLMGNY